MYERYCDQIYRYCVRRLFVPEVAEDATSTVFLRLTEHLDRLKTTDQAGIRRWLYTVARNVVNSHIRTAKRREEIFQAVWRERAATREQADPSDKADWPVLYQAIAELKPAFQDVIILRYFEGLAIREIAEILGRRPVSVRVALFRGIKEMRGHLGSSLSNDSG